MVARRFAIYWYIECDVNSNIVKRSHNSAVRSFWHMVYMYKTAYPYTYNGQCTAVQYKYNTL